MGRKSGSMTDARDVVVRPYEARVIQQCQPGEPSPFVIIDGLGSGEGFLEAISDVQWSPPGGKKGVIPNTQTGRTGLYLVTEFGDLIKKINMGAAGAMQNFIKVTFDCPHTISHNVKATKDSKAFRATDATGVWLVASATEWLGEQLQVADVRNGLINRFIWLAGDLNGQVLSMRVPIDAMQQQVFQQTLLTTADMVRGQTFTLDPAAQTYHHTKYVERRYTKIVDTLLHDATARIDVIALRVAMLIAAYNGKIVIDDVIMHSAWELMEYSYAVVEHMLSHMMPHTSSEIDHRICRAARKVAKEDGTFTKRMVWRGMAGTNAKVSSNDFDKAWLGLKNVGDVMALKDLGVHRPRGEWYRLGEGVAGLLPN
jgi:hypothetical protein